MTISSSWVFEEKTEEDKVAPPFLHTPVNLGWLNCSCFCILRSLLRVAHPPVGSVVVTTSGRGQWKQQLVNKTLSCTRLIQLCYRDGMSYNSLSDIESVRWECCLAKLHCMSARDLSRFLFLWRYSHSLSVWAYQVCWGQCVL